VNQSIVRLIFKDRKGSVEEIHEWRELLTPPNIALLMRRAHVSRAISECLSAGGTVTVEAKQ
jgi:hypothetical protein